MRKLLPGSVLLWLLVPACITKTQPQRSPEETVLQWQAHVDKNQFDLARQLSTAQAKPYLDYLQAITDDTTGAASVSTQLLGLTCFVHGDSALCSFFTEDEIGEKIPDTLLLLRVKGQWLVDKVEGFQETPLEQLAPGDEELVFPPGDSSEQ